MKKYEISRKDIQNNYFHFTSKKNLNSIDKKGLIPSRGKHAKYIEKKIKKFFCKGIR